MKELEKAIETCTKLQDEFDRQSYYYNFGEKVRLLGAFLEDDFSDVVSAMEDARDRIEELEEEKKELEKKVEEMEALNAELEAAANAQ